MRTGPCSCCSYNPYTFPPQNGPEQAIQLRITRDYTLKICSAEVTALIMSCFTGFLAEICYVICAMNFNASAILDIYINAVVFQSINKASTEN